MGFLNNVFGKKDKPIESNRDFWNWFQENEKDFFNAVKEQSNIEKDFFDRLTPQLAQLKHGFYFLTGMIDDNTVELILTADGNTKNIVFIEELIEEAPKINNWKFTAFKPSMDINNIGINMGGLKFDKNNLFFYSNDYPDEIDISIVYCGLTNRNEEQIGNGAFIFLDNYLGELDFLNHIDNLKIINKAEANKELIPIDKLKDFLRWRQKEFIEKYDGLRYNTEADRYAQLEAELQNGKPLFAVVNNTLLSWDSKASHPWILKVVITYKSSNDSGMPDNATYELLNTLEDEIMLDLKDFDGYLNVARQTADSIREIYFACKEYRKPAKVLFEITNKYEHLLKIEYDIYKDKYWQSLNQFKID